MHTANAGYSWAALQMLQGGTEHSRTGPLTRTCAGRRPAPDAGPGGSQRLGGSRKGAEAQVRVKQAESWADGHGGGRAAAAAGQHSSIGSGPLLPAPCASAGLGVPPNLLCVARLRSKASLQAWVLTSTWWAPGVPAVAQPPFHCSVEVCFELPWAGRALRAGPWRTRGTLSTAK